tara:strand:- start:748 stop:2121 length:1374 start_codon:yes stop_codon:yes gene_type:complete
MKIEIKSKKGLSTTLSVVVDKKIIQQKMNERLNELQQEVALKGFRPGKVPSSVIKSQFGKSIYGEVVDKVLRETSSKAISEKKLKVAGQPKIDLKQFGEGKDLNYELMINCLPSIKLNSLEKIKSSEYKIKIEKKIIDTKLQELADQNKKFEEIKDTEKSKIGDQISFDYSATVNGEKFEGSEGKGVQIELGKNLFLKGFDEQLVNVKKGDTKLVDAILPANHPKKELANQKTKFKCKIINVKKAIKSPIDDNFAKMMGAKDILDLKTLIEKQISSQYSQALNSITKKEILDGIEKIHEIDLPQNLVDQELEAMTKNLKPEEREKNKTNNENLAKSRIKLGLLLNEIGEKNDIKVSDEEISSEIQKQIKSMPGQEKMVLEYYQKNPSASQSLKGALYEEKIINLIKTKIKLSVKEIDTKDAEKVIADFNKPNIDKTQLSKTKPSQKDKLKPKKISKK